MALYINKNSKGEELQKIGKVLALLDDGAKVIEEPPEWEPGLVCVVENGWADAVCYVDSPIQFDICNKPDPRKKTWLIYPHAAKVAK